MQKYYKIITSDCLFKVRYDITDIYAISKGTCFVAKETKNTSVVSLRAGVPVLHFCDSAFDTMLWYSLVFGGCIEPWLQEIAGLYKKSCIYEIKPLSPVAFGKCKDAYRLFQFGANIIEFGDKIPTEQIAKQAIEEYKKNKLEKYIMYNRKMVKSQVKLWQNFYSM